MRGLVLSLLVLSLAPCFAYPTGSEALEARLMGKMGPGAQAWIVKEAGRISSARVISADLARNDATQYGSSPAQVDALTFLVLMKAERNADATVSNVAQADMSENASRQDARKAQQNSTLTNYAQQSQLSSGDQLVGSANGRASVSLLPSGGQTKPFTLRTNAPTTDTPAPPGLNLQDAMDRESQLDDLVADAMKAVTPASEGSLTAMP